LAPARVSRLDAISVPAVDELDVGPVLSRFPSVLSVDVGRFFDSDDGLSNSATISALPDFFA